MNKHGVVVLNIFKNDLEYIHQFISTCQEADLVIMLDTGSTDGSLAQARQLTQDLPNFQIESQQFNKVNFSEFRNGCFSIFKSTPEYHQPGHVVWIDTDESFPTGWTNAVRNLDLTESAIVNRIDCSKKFSTDMRRIFPIVDGKWKHAIHEHFESSQPFEFVKFTIDMLHNASELARPIEKKKLYLGMLNDLISHPGSSDELLHYLPHVFFSTYMDFADYTKIVELEKQYFEEIKQIQEPFKSLVGQYVLSSKIRLDCPVNLMEISDLLQACDNKSMQFRIIHCLSLNRKYLKIAKMLWHGYMHLPLTDNEDFLWNGDKDDIAKVQSILFRIK